MYSPHFQRHLDSRRGSAMAEADEDGISSSTHDITTGTVVLATPTSSDDVDGIDVLEKGVLPDDGMPDPDSLAVTGNTFSTALTNPTLQSLLTTPVNLTNAHILAQPEAIQIITVSNPSDLVSTTTTDGAGRVWQVVNPEMAIIAVGDPADFDQKEIATVCTLDDQNACVSSDLMSHDGSMLVSLPETAHSLPPNCPEWASRLKSCDRIGDYFRGYVESEVELDLLLTYHKQQTVSFWGTRQSPSPAKPSTRLMWKSQYVPFDGIPFVNSGSRAVVMECQYGPRRRGNFCKKRVEKEGMMKTDYKQTCPARIYIKKVKKFPEFAVDVNLDKKTMKLDMDKAFQQLKASGIDRHGQERYYVQLPTEKAHEFHDTVPNNTPQPSIIIEQNNCLLAERLHPDVSSKIRSLVASGETRTYAIRKQLRAFVTKELYRGDLSPERHDLTIFPTVNDLKNHIHQALKDIENGSLPVIASTVNVEIISNNEAAAVTDQGSDTDAMDDSALWQQAPVADSTNPVPETVTVTLTQNPGEDGHHVISRIETHLSDGSTQVNTTLTPETASLLSRLHPSMFPANSLLQLQRQQDEMQVQEIKMETGVDAEGDLIAGSLDPGPAVGLEADSSVVNVVNGIDSMPDIHEGMLTEPSSGAITMVTQSENLPQTFPMVTTSGGDPQFQMVTTSSEVQFLQVQNHVSDSVLISASLSQDGSMEDLDAVL
ncbi:hypothetical protein ScPMuIL_012559 [Solemya velum]